MKVRVLAVLSDKLVDEIKESLDFRITDQAGHCNIIFQNLGVEKNKRLKCNANVIFGAENVTCKVFHDVEESVGLIN